jgi:Holliday junction DNA helicase RuvA
MIGRLTGIVAEKAPPQVLIDVGGVGYEVDVPMSTFFNLPGLGEKVTLLTHFVVREDAQLLYGFLSAEERQTFRELVKISGIGPRTALSVLSGMSVADLAGAVSRQEGARLQKVPGIGKKTAERLLLELKGKLGPDLGAPRRQRGQRRPGRHRPGPGGPGLQREGRRPGAQEAAGRRRRVRRHQARSLKALG